MPTPKTLWLLLGLPAALVLVVFAFDSIWGGGHPSLSALLLFWGLYPSLTLYLSRALLGSEFPSPPLMLLGFLEYPLVGVGVVSLVANSQGRVAGRRTPVVVLFIYISAQVTAHLLLNLQSVNLRLMADTNPAVSRAAVDRIRQAGDAAAVPALQQKLVEDFEWQGKLEADLIDTLTVLGGAKGWQDLLDGGRLGVAGRAAWAWRFIVENERATNPDFRDEDIARLFDSLALKLAERLRAAPDSEASLTLLSVMKDRPDLCRKYFEFVPIGLRDPTPQVGVDLVRSLAVMKAGPPADFNYDRQAMIVNTEMSRFAHERDAVAEEWIAWAKSNAPCR